MRKADVFSLIMRLLFAERVTEFYLVPRNKIHSEKFNFDENVMKRRRSAFIGLILFDKHDPEPMGWPLKPCLCKCNTIITFVIEHSFYF